MKAKKKSRIKKQKRRIRHTTLRTLVLDKIVGGEALVCTIGSIGVPEDLLLVEVEGFRVEVVELRTVLGSIEGDSLPGFDVATSVVMLTVVMLAEAETP